MVKDILRKWNLFLFSFLEMSKNYKKMSMDYYVLRIFYFKYYCVKNVRFYMVVWCNVKL